MDELDKKGRSTEFTVPPPMLSHMDIVVLRLRKSIADVDRSIAQSQRLIAETRELVSRYSSVPPAALDTFGGR